MPPAPARQEHAAPPATKDEAPFLVKLGQARDQLAAILPEHVNVDRVIRIVRGAWMTDTYLQKCNPASILTAVRKAAELGLEPNGALKQCYLVPFKDECQLIIGYAGLLELARRTNQLGAIETRLVNRNDHFTLAYNPTPIVEHVPNLIDPGPMIGVYAYAEHATGGLALEYMRRDQIEAIHQRLPERQQGSPGWKNEPGEMWRKIVLKRLLKRLPQSPQLADALAHDNAEPVDTEATTLRTIPPPSGMRPRSVAALNHRLNQRPALEAPPVDDEPNDADAPDPGPREPGSDDL